MLSQVMSQVQDFISMAFYCINCNPWLILLLVLAIIPSFLANLISTVRITHFQEVKLRKKRTGLPALFGS
jgi:hypothetical protein